MYRQRLLALFREARFPIASFGADHFVLTPGIVGDLRVRPYVEQWKLAIENGWFHIKMQDHSLFIFNEGAVASYSYLHAPILVPTFPDYLRELKAEDTPGSRRRFLSDYQRVVDTAGERQNVTPIRFDYDECGYRAGVHPVAHIHIGLENEVRLSANRMTAVSFVLFVMRHMYPKSWERLLARQGERRLIGSIRNSSMEVPPPFWCSLDEVELHFR